MWGRYQIHVLVSDFFRSALDPVSLTELPCEGAPVLGRIWRKAAAAAHRVSWLTCGWGSRKKKHPLTTFSFTLWTKLSDPYAWSGSDQSRSFAKIWRCGCRWSAAPRLCQSCPRWCVYLSPFIAYRWPHSSISHNSAARQESRGPLHSSVIFHSSAPLLLLFFLPPPPKKRNWVSIVNIPPGSQWRYACVLRSGRVASSPTRACCVAGA